jgi:(p)ppGpp synthase/HD superfamily hydrolase
LVRVDFLDSDSFFKNGMESDGEQSCLFGSPDRLSGTACGLRCRTMTTPSVEDTIRLIRDAHAGQVDKGGVEYWKHPVSVMNRLGPEASDEIKLVALLHDVIEDTTYTAEDLLRRGYPESVVQSVKLLTKPKGVPYLDCIKAIAASGDRMAIAVKRADNQDNLDPGRLAKLPPDKRAGDDKYRRSIEILTAALGEA